MPGPRVAGVHPIFTGLSRARSWSKRPRPRPPGRVAAVARYDDGVSAEATRAAELPPRLPFVRRAFTRAIAEVRLTALAIWRGAVGFYNSDDLTFASSIAYYALLSRFPFFLLIFSILGSVTADPADRGAILEFILRYFPRQFEFVTTQMDSLQHSRIQL